jgi:phosphotransferase system HPr-like phosphotransfer protein
MLSVLSLGAGKGTEVTLHADDGAEGDQALRTLADLIIRDLDATGSTGA